MSEARFFVDAEKCSGCSLCIIACKDEHVGNNESAWTKPQPATGHFWIGLRPFERGEMPRLRVTYLPVHCQHCENAPCIRACPDDAIKTRDDGLVWIDPATCSGCGLCKDACPYDVIYMNPKLNLAQKCTGCAHLVDKGQPPRCVDTCPHDAIVFGAQAEQQRLQAAGEGTLETYLPERETKPRVYWKGLPKPWIAGCVIDAASDEVIAGAEVKCVDLSSGGSMSARSDEFGEFWLKGRAKGHKYRVDIRKQGYAEFLSVVTTDDDCDLGTVALKPGKSGK